MRFLSVGRYAAAVQDGSQYFVLLIITDGVISDMAQTKEAIVNVRNTDNSSFCPTLCEAKHIQGYTCVGTEAVC